MMTKQEMLTKKYDSLMSQQQNIFKMFEATENDISKVQEEISFELNKRLNNVEQRKARYEMMFDNIEKQKKDIKAELQDIQMMLDSKEKNRTNKFGKLR